MLAGGINGEAGFEHKSNDGCFVVPGGVGDLTAIELGEAFEQLGVRVEDRSRRWLVSDPAGVDQFHVIRARSSRRRRTSG